MLSVTDAKGVNVDNTKEPVEDEEKQQSATITVLASPEQARVITSLENDGVAHVALISRNNEKLAEELLAEQDVILQEIYFLEPSDEETEEMAGYGEAENPETDAVGETGEEPASGEQKESGKESGTSGENSPDKEGNKEENKT